MLGLYDRSRVAVGPIAAGMDFSRRSALSITLLVLSATLASGCAAPAATTAPVAPGPSQLSQAEREEQKVQMIATTMQDEWQRLGATDQARACAAFESDPVALVSTLTEAATSQLQASPDLAKLVTPEDLFLGYSSLLSVNCRDGEVR